MSFSPNNPQPRIALLAACFLFLIFSGTALAEPASLETRIHTVKKGETVFAIARLYGLSTELLMEANGLSDAKKLKEGQKILIPSLYQVKKGDTLFGLARKFGVSVEELRKLNDLPESSVLKTGDSLVVASASKVQDKPDSKASKEDAVKIPPDEPETTRKTDSTTAKANGEAISAVKESEKKAEDIPAPPKAPDRTVDGKVEWPAKGIMSYLEGKLFGILIVAQKGDPVKAVSSGTVISAGPYRGFGQVVFVQGEDGYVFVYGGNESVKVRGGDSIRKGVELGTVGLDAKDGKPNAYFIVFRNGDPIDPALAPRT